MFAPSLGRVARSTSSLSSAPVLTLGRAGLSTIRPSHQRRYSSSKSSIASKSALAPSSKKKPAQDVEHNAAPQLQGIEAGAKATDTAAEIAVATSMNNVPHVPPTTHISDAGKKRSNRYVSASTNSSRRASVGLLRTPPTTLLPPRGMAATRIHGRLRGGLQQVRARQCACANDRGDAQHPERPRTADHRPPRRPRRDASRRHVPHGAHGAHGSHESRAVP